MIRKNKKEYVKYSESHAKKSPLLKNSFFAFLCGGAICVLGQCLYDLYDLLRVPVKTVKMLVPVSLIFLSCVLTGIGVYDRIAKHSGAGTLVPITGFANAVMSPVMDYKSEGMILGAGAKMFTVAGPVIVFGCIFSAVYGVIYYIVTACL